MNRTRTSLAMPFPMGTPDGPPPQARTAVITRTRSRPLLLERAIESVLAQSDPHFVHVVVNDGGDADELEATLAPHLERYAGRLQVLHHPTSLGMEAASNRGLQVTASRYVTIHDDDDAWEPTFLARMVGRLEAEPPSSRMAGAVCWATEIRERLEGVSVTPVSSRSLRHLLKEPSLWKMLSGNFFPPISFLYRRDVLETIGGAYREDLPVQGDWEFNVRFLQHFDIVLVEEHLALYHTRIAEKTPPAPNYANSLHGVALHDACKIRIRNEYLRRDLERGQLGIGYLMNLNPMLMRSDRMATGVIGVWERVTRFLGR